jgi:hypothetical protein
MSAEAARPVARLIFLISSSKVSVRARRTLERRTRSLRLSSPRFSEIAGEGFSEIAGEGGAGTLIQLSGFHSES